MAKHVLINTKIYLFFMFIYLYNYTNLNKTKNIPVELMLGKSKIY